MFDVRKLVGNLKQRLSLHGPAKIAVPAVAVALVVLGTLMVQAAPKRGSIVASADKTHTSVSTNASDTQQTLGASQDKKNNPSTNQTHQTPSDQTPTPNQTQNTLPITVSTTSLTFAVGAGSDQVTAKTTDGSKVVWTINSHSSYLIPHGSASQAGAAATSFFVDSPFPNAKPGTYTISVDAFDPSEPGRHASKTITVTLKPRFTFNIVMDFAQMTSGPLGRRIPFHIVTLSGTPAQIHPSTITIDPPGQVPSYYYSTSSAMLGPDRGYMLIETEGTGVTYIKHVTVTFTAFSGMYSKTISFPLDLP